MCRYENDDCFRKVNKYDIYNCNLGDVNDKKDHSLGKVRPCIIISSPATNTDQYIVVPLRTEHSMDVDTPEKAEHIVNIRRNKGRIYVPVKFVNQYSFADVTQIVRVDVYNVYSYVGTLTNPRTIRRLDNSLKDLLHIENPDVQTFISDYISVNVPPIEVINNIKIQNFIIEMMNAYSNNDIGDFVDDIIDIKLNVNKYDVWNTYSTSFNKVVIMQSENVYMKNFLVCPIYRETSCEVNKDNIDEYIYEMKRRGKPCIPFYYKDELRFIALHRMFTVAYSQLKERDYYIANDEVRESINQALIKMFFTDNENSNNIIEPSVPLLEVVSEETEIQDTTEIVNEEDNTEIACIEKEEDKNKKKSGRKPTPIPTGFTLYYRKLKAGNITKKAICEKYDITLAILNNMIKRLEQSNA